MEIKFDNPRQRNVLKEALHNYLSVRLNGLDPSCFYGGEQLEQIAREYCNRRYPSHESKFKEAKIQEKIQDFKAYLEIREAL